MLPKAAVESAIRMPSSTLGSPHKLPEPGGAPGGATGIVSPFTGWVFVLSFDTLEDQLFLVLKNGSECANPSTGIGIAQFTFNVIGGTGRFEGASGTVAHTQTLMPLIVGFGGRGFFSSNTGAFDGLITLK